MQLQYFDIVNANTHFHWDMTTSSNILKAKSNSFSGLPQLSDSSSVDSGVVIIKAFMNACKELGVSRDDASKIVGVDNSTLNRNKNKGFDPHSKTGELCLQFVRVYRSLFAIAGGDKGFMRHWLHTYNNALSSSPLESMYSVRGLIQVNEYLDAMRGKV